ncbi:MAG: NADH-quinone oxidoreductase subunit NuoG [Acidimicrobiales bacterium]
MADTDAAAKTDATPKTTVSVEINGHPIEANPGELVIEAAERAGVHIPRFCYHPRMRPVGMCRMCLVEIDAGRGPALQPSCMIPVSPDMKVDTESERTRKAQDGVLEFLLINHPLDCPVCDKGGECPLQDNTVAFGPGESRFVEEKRHYEKPIPISDLVLLDRERCILCDRCTRFAKEVAGDPLIHFLGRGARTEVNTFPDLPFSSYFSGNTVQICPVGALTASSYRFKARPWDLTEVESTCTTCSVGCSVGLQSSRNRLLRMVGVDNDAVNWGWLCDKGRFGTDVVEAPERLTEPLVDSQPVRWATALGRAATLLRDARTAGAQVGVIGGARLSNEGAYAWSKLARVALGTDNVDAQLGDGVDATVLAGLARTTIAGACTPGGTIVLLGPDPKETLGVLYLRLRHAVVEDRATLIEIGHGTSGLSAHATHRLWGLPGGELVGLARRAVELAPEGKPITVIVGRTALTEDPAVIAAAAAILADAGATFLPALDRGNVMGALDLGLAPGLLPGRVTLEDGRAWFSEAWGCELPAQAGSDTAGMLRAAADGQVSVLVLLGADPIADFPDRDLATRALARAKVIAIDVLPNASNAGAAVLFPAALAAETNGTTTNLEGRVLPLRQGVTPPGTARADWIIAAELAAALDVDLGFDSMESVWSEIEALSSAHQGMTADALAGQPQGLLANGRGGQDGRPPVVTTTGNDQASGARATPAAVPLSDTALRLVVRPKMYDAGTLVAHSAGLRDLGRAHLAGAEDASENGSALARVALHPDDLEHLGARTGATVDLVAPGGRLRARAEGDDGVLRGTAVVVANVPGVPVNGLGAVDALTPVLDVQVEVIR